MNNTLDQSGKIYFISDVHLGSPDHASSLEREKRLIAFLDEIRADASDIFFMGDIFDFWFEYKRVVPKGFIRLLGKLAELSDAGIRLHYFTGNHDIWLFDYLPEQTGLKIYRSATAMTLNGKHFFLAHGDGFDESDRTFRLIKKIFTNKTLQWAFARLHPNFAFWLAHWWSKQSRMLHGEDPFRGEEEPIIRFARQHLADQGYDYLIFGHRHCPTDYPLNEHSRVIILGDWVTHFSYAVFDGEQLELRQKAEGRRPKSEKS